MGWRTIYVENCDKLSLYLNNLLVIKDNAEYKIPLSDISSIVVEDFKATFTMKLLNRIAESSILLITCDDKHNPCGQLLSTNNYCRQYKAAANQIKWDEDSKDELWKIIIKQKLINQKEILIKLKKDTRVIKLLETYIEEVEKGDVTNREGLGAKVYFRELFGNDFIRGQKEEVINSALNYGYTILTSKLSRIISGKGLLTYIGIHHKNEYNQYNFSCDLVEIFRPVVDYYIISSLKHRDYFSREDRLGLINLLNAKISYNNKNEYISNAMEKMVDITEDYLEKGQYIQDKLPNLKNLILYEL